MIMSQSAWSDWQETLAEHQERAPWLPTTQSEPEGLADVGFGLHGPLGVGEPTLAIHMINDCPLSSR
jgi:hypothetical protein